MGKMLLLHAVLSYTIVSVSSLSYDNLTDRALQHKWTFPGPKESLINSSTSVYEAPGAPYSQSMDSQHMLTMWCFFPVNWACVQDCLKSSENLQINPWMFGSDVSGLRMNTTSLENALAI